MKTVMMALSLMLWTGLASIVAFAAEGQAPAEGGPLPAITLTTPKDAAHQAYLGLAGKKQFTVADIPAEVVVVQIFNMY